MALIEPIVFLVDVDNTLLDNDRIQDDLKRHLEREFGADCRDRYWAILEQLFTDLGYRDYLGALQRFRVEHPREPHLLSMSSFLVDYPFANRLYPGSLDVLERFRSWGSTVILSDGDVVFQPRKVERSGIFEAVDGHVLIYIHKEEALDDVEQRYPAEHYVLVDDKVRILDAVKKIWGDRVTTIFPRQGQYAHDAKSIAGYRPADLTAERIGDLLDYDLAELLAANNQFKISLEVKVMKATQLLHNLGQSLWLDNITRDLLNTGTLKRYIDEFSVTGLTSNPTIFDHAIKNSTAYDAAIRKKLDEGKSGEELFFELALEDLTRAADLFRPIYDRTNGVDGWVSLEVSPLLAHDTTSTVAAAKSLHARAGRPNLFIKIPGTKEGLPAIEEAIFAGVPINVTLLFSHEHYVAAAEAFLRGIERRIDDGLQADVGSVASLFVSRWDAAVSGKTPAVLNNQLGIAIAKRTYKAYRELLGSPRWQRIYNAGARPQRLLWASTGTKDPKASDVLYVKALAAPFTVNTMPEGTLKALADHGELSEIMSNDGGDCEAALAQFAKAGIDIDALAAKLQDEGAKSFVTSWNELMGVIASKSAKLAKAS
ncbi:MAG TPA: transaldolase [Chthoniobacteraceae bacterium]|nr:transaldolase [Chthoniobacteraceae bacterium]